MSINGSQPIPVVQMGFIEKIAEVAQNHPEVQQSMLQEHFGKEIAKESTQVTSVGKKETNALKSNKDKEKDSASDERNNIQRKKLKKVMESDQAHSTEGEISFEDLFVGNIFHGKV